MHVLVLAPKQMNTYKAAANENLLCNSKYLMKVIFM